MFRLTVEQGDPLGATYDFAADGIVIGRSHSARARLSASDISGQHVRITVQDGQAVAENLSRFQTLLEGRPITAPTPLKTGQRLTVGRSTVLVFATVAGEAAADDAEAAPTGAAATGEHHTDVTGGTGAAVAATGQTPPRTVAPAAAEAKTMAGPTGGSDALSQPGSWSNEGPASEGMTRAMQTRAAGQDEIEFLRNVERQRSRGRVLMIVGAVLVVGIAAAVIATHQPEPEKTVSWPVDAAGDLLEGRADSALGGFSLVYPKTGDAAVQTVAGGLAVTCTLGKRQDLLLRLYLDEVVDDQHVKETLADSIARWKAQRAAGPDKWNIDQPLPMNLFVGNDNGIPFKTLPYQRQDEESWSGLATVLRHGRRLIVVRAEVRSADRARAEELLYNRFLDPTREFVRSHWEGAPDLPRTSVADMLSRAREEQRRMAPATWVDVEEQLVCALRKAVLEKRAEDEKDALDMLVALRTKKALWYNEQLCQKEAALAQGDEARVRRLAQLCQGVFSDSNDQRFYEVRKW